MMQGRDRYAAIAAIDRLSEVIRREFGDSAHEIWPVVSTLLRNYLGNRQTTITSLADSSYLSRTTARRVIFALKEQGLVKFTTVSGSNSCVQTVVPVAP